MSSKTLPLVGSRTCERQAHSGKLNVRFDKKGVEIGLGCHNASFLLYFGFIHSYFIIEWIRLTSVKALSVGTSGIISISVKNGNSGRFVTIWSSSSFESASIMAEAPLLPANFPPASILPLFCILIKYSHSLTTNPKKSLTGISGNFFISTFNKKIILNKLLSVLLTDERRDKKTDFVFRFLVTGLINEGGRMTAASWLGRWTIVSSFVPGPDRRAERTRAGYLPSSFVTFNCLRKSASYINYNANPPSTVKT
ncbi:MAG: hypothetical protein SCARUB_03297 [Candidatus Scalindua rubra]|uniref:Uncharacterized protein n=1 Tax=Candidatus Scalindua rubra TaxID=1872076 RepID=A0A1E3X7F7_9BACT|nr:MAG: hypothetical protein SCARUB_03297 [Candidatus Scalindua rubra]